MIFSEEKYFNANEIPNYHLFQWEAPDGNFSMQMAYSLDNQNAISIPSAPYAGIEFSGMIEKPLIERAIAAMIEALKRRNVHSIQIKQAPNCVTHLPKDLMLGMGFRAQREINHHQDLKVYQLDRLHKMQQRRISKCEKLGFHFQEETLDQAEPIHDFIAQCRQQQGLVINITKEKFLSVVHAIPEHFRIYSVFTAEGKRCAATVCIKVNEHVMYNYLPAFDRAYSTHSPLAYLLHQISLQLQQEAYNYFDLGISSIAGQSQESLIRFKQRMGGLVSDRLTFFMQL
jgi:hypothetical protein